jgi:signal transduction histidine kinase
VPQQALLREGRPPSPRFLPALLVALLVGVGGLIVASYRAPRLELTPSVLMSDVDHAVPVDLLGVAHDDFVEVSGGRHVLLHRVLEGEAKTVWQSNFTHPIWLSGAVDVTGDGTQEVCLHEGDSTGARAIVLGREGQVISTFGPIRGTSMRAGYPWDGKVSISGRLIRAGRRLVIAALIAGFSGQPRGVIAFDLESSQVAWEYRIGAQPHQVLVSDVDGDGRDEVLVATYAPDNGVSVNGVDDSHIHVLALSSEGRRLWHQQVGGYFATASILPLVVSPGEPRRIVVATASGRGDRPEPGKLLVLDGRDGRELARLEFAHGLGMPVAIPAGGSRFVVGGRGGDLRMFDAALEPVAAARFKLPIEAWASADLDGDGRAEIVASTPREALVLDQRLRVRARIPFANPRGAIMPVSLARAGLDHSRLLVLTDRAIAVDMVSVPPLADPRRLTVIAGAALFAGALTVLASARRRRATGPAGAAAREFLLDYHQIRHETFDQERTFARVRLWAQAETAGHPLNVGVLEGACDEYLRIGSPSLQRLIAGARSLRVDGHLVRRIRALERDVAAGLRAALTAAPAARPPIVVVVLGTIERLSRACFDAYRQVAMREPCRPDLEVQEAMLAKRNAIELAGIETTFHADAEGRQPVLFDRAELRALIAELIENSIRALDGVENPRIAISVAGHPTDPRWCIVLVRDNGPGIPAARRHEIFHTATSARPGGGAGLQIARDRALRWMGHLVIEEPLEGWGAAVRVTLRVLLPHESQRPRTDSRITKAPIALPPPERGPRSTRHTEETRR